MKIAIVVPHIFMHEDILPDVIFSPGKLALDLANGLVDENIDVTLCTPGPITTKARNITADLSYFEAELAGRDDTYIDLLKKHPLTFITLARQVQSEILADVIARANNDEFDIVHIYTNEEDTALPFAKLCQKPIVFTHHDPFNFLVKYKNVFPKYKHLNWLSISNAQRKGMPKDTNWLATIYHGIDEREYTPSYTPTGDYVLYMGRIIESKGVHIAVQAVQTYNQLHPEKPLKLKIAGKHYSGTKDQYWQEKILPHLDDPNIEYVGFAKTTSEKQELLGNTKALLIPSVFEEPFGMVMIESLACATPVIGLDSGAIPEVIINQKTGFVIPKDDNISTAFVKALENTESLDRKTCRLEFEIRFTLQHMTKNHIEVYRQLITTD